MLCYREHRCYVPGNIDGMFPGNINSEGNCNYYCMSRETIFDQSRCGILRRDVTIIIVAGRTIHVWSGECEIEDTPGSITHSSLNENNIH